MNGKESGGGCGTIVGSLFFGWLVICIGNLFDSVIGYILGIGIIVFGLLGLNMKKTNEAAAGEKIRDASKIVFNNNSRKGSIKVDDRKWMFVKSNGLAREFNPYDFTLNKDNRTVDIEVRSLNFESFRDEDFFCRDVQQYFRYLILLDKNLVVCKQHSLYKRNKDGKLEKVNYYGEFFDKRFDVNDDEFFKILANSFKHLLNDEITPVFSCDEDKWIVTGQYSDTGENAEEISVDSEFMQIKDNSNFSFIARQLYTDRFYDCKGFEYKYSCDGDSERLSLIAITYFIKGKAIFVVRSSDDSIYISYPWFKANNEWDQKHLNWLYNRINRRKNLAVKYLPVGRKTIIPEDFDINLTDERTLKRIFDSVIGLQVVKDKIIEHMKVVLLEEKRKKQGITSSIGMSKHMIFTGNPGTGKTTIARLVADIFADSGVIEKPVLVETDREGLVAGYIGQTATKTKEVFNKAIGGVLFIDEAYSLARGVENDFGREAIDTLIKLMEDHKKDTVVILAGYTKEMNELLSTNPGIKSRFPTIIEFPDYSKEELAEICYVLLRNKEVSFGSDVKEKILLEIGRKKDFSGADSGNGRLASNFVDAIFSNQAKRLANNDNSANISKEMLSEIKVEDIPEATVTKEGYDLEAELNKVIGMDDVKNALRALASSVRIQQMRKNMGLEGNSSFTNHFIFAGNPGTGKTTMARMIGEILHDLGVISSTNLVEVSRNDLVAEYVGQTAPKTTEVFKRAAGGVLFIDEAYTLYSSSGSNDFGKEALNTLLKLIEDDRNTVVILAGYEENMKQLLQMNPGLNSRFPDWIYFPDYSADELVEIADIQLKSRAYEMSADAKKILKEIMQMRKEKAAKENRHLDNARGVRNIIEKSIKQQNFRLYQKMQKNGGVALPKRDMILILPEDLPTEV